MSLDDELRSSFEREATTRSAPPPDPGALVRGGRARRRRRTLRRAGAGAGAATAVLVGAAAVGLLRPGATDAPLASRPTTASSPSTFPESPDWGRPELPPGTYRAFVGVGAAGARIEVDLTVTGDNWSSGDFPMAAGGFGAKHAGIGVYQPRTLAAGSGCLDDRVTTDLGRTPQALAEQLARLPRSTVLEAPAPTEVLGLPAVHLRAQIDVECSTFYRVADSPVGERGITYTPTGTGFVVIDFWVIEVAGALVVVDEWHDVGSPETLVAQAASARESLVLVVGG